MGRHNYVAPEDRLCKFCGEKNIVAIEDEYHVLYHCSEYDYIRAIYVSKDEFGFPNEYNFIKYLQINDRERLVNLSNFVSSMFKIRRQKLESNIP